MVRGKVLLAGTAFVALGTLAACGSDTPTAQPPQTVTVTQTPSQGSTPTTGSSGAAGSSTKERPESVKSDQAPKCAPTTLTGAIESGDAAAGNRYAKLVVTNSGSKPCTLYGYGGLELTNASGAANPTKLTRKPDPAPSLVNLMPGQKAYKNLHWGAVPDGTESTTGPCQPESTGAKVTPPDETATFTVKFDFGSVCQHGTIDGSAYYK